MAGGSVITARAGNDSLETFNASETFLVRVVIRRQ